MISDTSFYTSNTLVALTHTLTKVLEVFPSFESWSSYITYLSVFLGSLIAVPILLLIVLDFVVYSLGHACYACAKGTDFEYLVEGVISDFISAGKDAPKASVVNPSTNTGLPWFSVESVLVSLSVLFKSMYSLNQSPPPTAPVSRPSFTSLVSLASSQFSFRSYSLSSTTVNDDERHTIPELSSSSPRLQTSTGLNKYVIDAMQMINRMREEKRQKKQAIGEKESIIYEKCW
ncbi:hypothetical protein BABINDRAFT_6915 [Babjeviella inositovora NRRL Y-12698]|uniref:Uncharacterized protein n=1 Tax=Babjeviella inositovora NRRL Y-12698 TaxID=984486 RepID=A0A1E3QTR4_9ASCO|nr:uncharacterized protein BABINDRAFT_6915 [Babjeviella inositovora NRRL Y-12698]ODQ81073.1 hypothetical protein BABINDRAFT_6915 [Babjeviella inositovora NRRL Y-12698]